MLSDGVNDKREYIHKLFEVVHESTPFISLETKSLLTKLFFNDPSIYIYLIELALEVKGPLPLQLIRVLNPA